MPLPDSYLQRALARLFCLLPHCVRRRDCLSSPRPPKSFSRCVVRLPCPAWRVGVGLGLWHGDERRASARAERAQAALRARLRAATRGQRWSADAFGGQADAGPGPGGQQGRGRGRLRQGLGLALDLPPTRRFRT